MGEVNQQQLMKMLKEYGRYWKTVPGQIYARHQLTEKEFPRLF